MRKMRRISDHEVRRARRKNDYVVDSSKRTYVEQPNPPSRRGRGGGAGPGGRYTAPAAVERQLHCKLRILFADGERC